MLSATTSTLPPEPVTPLSAHIRASSSNTLIPPTIVRPWPFMRSSERATGSPSTIRGRPARSSILPCRCRGCPCRLTPLPVSVATSRSSVARPRHSLPAPPPRIRNTPSRTARATTGFIAVPMPTLRRHSACNGITRCAPASLFPAAPSPLRAPFYPTSVRSAPAELMSTTPLPARRSRSFTGRSGPRAFPP